MSLVFEAIPFKQHRIQMYMAIANVGDLEHFMVAIWNPQSVEGRRGYQRSPNEDRIKKIAKYLERRESILPVAGLVNVREKNRITFNRGRLVIPDGIHVYVVDMQHRMKGLIRAKDDGSIQPSFQFPIVVTEGLPAVDEATQFYIINTKAKKMDIALTRRLLIEYNRVRDVSDVKPWEVAAVRMTIALNKKIRENPWFNSIRQPNEEKLKSHIATEKSFVTSLRALLAQSSKQVLRKSRRLANFWSAIRSNLPEAFDEPNRYLIQKTPGMFAFNFFIAPWFLSKYRDNEFPKRLSGLRKLKSDFWKRRNQRGARRFGTGMGGYANLARHVEKYI